MGTLAKIRRLHLREGVPIKEIERRTGIARNTIKSWLRKGQMVEPKYPPREVATKLDGYTEQLATWLKADAHRGKRDRRTVKLMYEELAAQGYRGGYGRVAAFARRWREEQAGSANKGAFVPLKFVLGEAFQFDWSTEYAFVGGLRRRLEVAHTKLCASRAFWLVAYPTQSHEMLFDAHARSFAAAWSELNHPEWPALKVVDVLQDEQTRLMPNPKPFDGYVEVPARVSSTALVHLQRNRYSVPSEHAHEVVSLRLYPDRLEVVAENARVATHVRSFERSQTFYDWRHYVSLIERKPGALRNGAPFETLPEALKKLQGILLRREGGDRVMAQVLAAVPVHGLDAVLVAAELALEAGKPSGEHVLNVLARLKAPSEPASLEAASTPLKLAVEPLANVQRYDRLRGAAGEATP